MFIPFTSDISKLEKPKRFTFPFYYQPHPLAKLASQQLQKHLENVILHQKDWYHNFGIYENDPIEGRLGKMFGVLVCEDQEGNLGQLWAFSGKLANSNTLDKFVPAVFDTLDNNLFYKKQEQKLNEYTGILNNLKNSKDYQILLEKEQSISQQKDREILQQKNRIKTLKKQRDQKRLEAEKTLNHSDFEKLKETLSNESKKESILLKKMSKYWKYQTENIQKEIKTYKDQIEEIGKKRALLSLETQQKLFDSYLFLNINQENKSALKIFQEYFKDHPQRSLPPAGIGECAAPKLLQYAFKEKLKPLCIAEFWWGISPSSNIRKHQQFYPSCRSKCEPLLLQHMLKGLEIEENPLEQELCQNDKEIKILYQDKDILVIHKPHELLSVPGKKIKDSVYSRILDKFPRITGSIIVHRLDMSTSGIMLLAKHPRAYKKLQKQFIERSISKTYLAILDGYIPKEEGKISLPLRVDLDNRPQQMVCYEYGKPATTLYKVLKEQHNKTLIEFSPITGRTHQLRVHSSHVDGLNTPILGDDLYGTIKDRLYLHAWKIKFTQPITKEELIFETDIPFDI